MLGFAWLALREAQEALRNGRLEEAHRLLAQPSAQGYKGSWELLQQLAHGFVARGERHLQQDDPEAAWKDLLLAEQVGVADPTAAQLRQALTRLGLAEVRTLLELGEATRAGEVIGRVRNRAVRQSELQLLDEVARGWALAREQANRGDFAQAVPEAERLRRLWPGPVPALEQLVRDLEQRRRMFTTRLIELHEAATRKDWRWFVELAEQVLAVAPQHEEARKARSRAWKVVEPATIAVGPLRAEPPPAVEPSPEAAAPRLLLWIDGVGGYLVCLGNRVTLGQATPETTVDIPLFADVSRLHATLTRDTEGYVLEAVRGLQVNAKTVDRALLQANDRITLGTCCQLQFRQPVPVSASARLDLVSGHRLPMAVDGVLLMADTLVLGPGELAHVSMPDLPRPIILFRQKDGLGIRSAGSFVVNGQPCADRSSIGFAGTVSGEDFALGLEPLTKQLGLADRRT